MMLNTVCGNEKIVEELKEALNKKRLMHAVLICGAKGMGAGYLAKCLAADYLYPPESGAQSAGANAVMLGQSPEYIVLKSENGIADIKIDSVRNARKNLHATALSSNNRVVHIKNAQKLNLSSANALLKVLEEPPSNVLFILNAYSEAAVIETIRSRCAVYNMQGTSSEQCAQYLQEHLKKHKNIRDLSQKYAEIFGGKIGTCIKALENKNSEKIIAHVEDFFTAALQKNAYSLGAILSNYEKDKSMMLDFLHYLNDYSAYMLRNTKESEQRKTAAAIINSAQNTREFAQKNANIKLILSAMVINIVKAN